MNEQYRDYPRGIREEIESLKDREVENAEPKKKGLSFWQKLVLTFTLLTNKAPK